MCIFNLSEAEDLVRFFGGDDAEITVGFSQEGHSGPGLYAHFADYPDEGAIKLGMEDAP